MTPQKQKFRHNPAEGVYGDCARTVLAMLLDIPVDDVPHFLWDNADGIVFNQRVRMFLESVGLREVSIPFTGDLSAIMRFMRDSNPGIYYMLMGESRNHVNHVVVCLNDKIVADPALDDSGIVGPADDGYYWVSFLVSLHKTDGVRLKKHTLYETSDPDRPAAILDRNGDVVLGMCRDCGLAEIELEKNPVCHGKQIP